MFSKHLKMSLGNYFSELEEALMLSPVSIRVVSETNNIRLSGFWAPSTWKTSQYPIRWDEETTYLIEYD